MTLDYTALLNVAWDLEDAGLLWLPEIGDEVSQKAEPSRISILVDPQGMTPVQLRETFLWLPTVEQLLSQFEARQAILFHAGLELSAANFHYRIVVRRRDNCIESSAATLRTALALSLRDLLLREDAKLH